MRCALVSGPDFVTDRVDERARESFEDHGLICVRNLLPPTLIERLERTLRQLIGAQFSEALVLVGKSLDKFKQLGGPAGL